MLKIAINVESQSPWRDKRARLRLSHELDALADKLMHEAELELAERGRSTTKGALSYRDGVIIALLTIAPMRRRNLASLALGRHLVHAGRGWSILLRCEETKGKGALEYQLSEKVFKALDRYLEVFRPAIHRSGRHAGFGLRRKASQLPATLCTM